MQHPNSKEKEQEEEEEGKEAEAEQVRGVVAPAEWKRGGE